MKRTYTMYINYFQDEVEFESEHKKGSQGNYSDARSKLRLKFGKAGKTMAIDDIRLGAKDEI